MTVVLFLLKAVGILLLGVLGVLLAVLLLVLFVPIRYSAEGSYREKLSVGARVTWLFRLLSVRLSYEGGLSWAVRLAGWQILPGKSGKKATAAQEPDADAGQGPAAEDRDAGAVAEAAEKAETPGNTQAQPEADTRKADETAEGNAAAEASPEDPPPEEGGQEAGGAQGFSDRIEALFQKSEDAFRSAEEKLETFSGTAEKYLALLEREDTRIALRTVFGQALRILRHILPRQLNARFTVGTGNPAADGQIAAWQGMLYPFLQEKVLIVPDFEEKRVEGSFTVKGRITVCRLLVCGLAVISKKEVRQLIGRLRKKEEKKDGGKS